MKLHSKSNKLKCKIAKNVKFLILKLREIFDVDIPSQYLFYLTLLLKHYGVLFQYTVSDTKEFSTMMEGVYKDTLYIEYNSH